MFSSNRASQAPVTEFTRHLGSYTGAANGPVIICVGGIHGNEPAGAQALRQVLRQLQEQRPPFKGRLIGLAGNVGALQRGTRYLHRDLNRMWSPARIRELQARTLLEIETAESGEQRALLAALEAALAEPYTQAVFLDLHTTSANGAPFGLISDTLANRYFALRLPAPVILGLEENLDGTLLNYINELGHAALGFEAGQHQSALSVQNHEAVIWVTLVAAGCLKPEHVPHWRTLLQTLREATRGLPQFFELRYRHAIEPADEFVMKPGFVNFQRVERGQVLATDRRGEIRAREEGYLFMPLYQAQGEDGFFLVRAVKPFWLRVSAGLRRLRLDRTLACWPGVRRLPGDPNSLVINTKVARWFVVEICHLLGFRRHAQRAGQLIVTRRKQPTTHIW
jgi:succinylglutamate desuccinylase